MSVNTAQATATLRDLTVRFDRAVNAARPFYSEVCTLVPSSRSDEKYAWLGDSPSMIEWLGERKFKQLRAADYLLANKLWENSLLIPRHNIEDDALGIYGPLMEKLAAEAALHPDKLLFQSIVAAESTACFDGQFFYDTDHAWGDSGTQSNDLTFNATDHTNVTSAEFKSAYHAARLAMLQFKNDQGEPLNRPTVDGMGSLMLLVPPTLEQQAQEAINAPILGLNSNVVLDRPRIVCSPYLTSGVKFYLFNLGDALKPFVFQARQPLRRQMKGYQDGDIEFKDAKFMCEARYNVGYLAWWTTVLTTFN